MYTFDLSLSQLLSRFSTCKLTTGLEEKLNENMPLEEYLKSDEAIMCYKDMNKNAQKYFDKSKIKKLIEYITKEPETDEYLRGHKYPYVAGELLKTYNERIHDLFTMNDDEYNEKHNKKEVIDDKKDSFFIELEKSPVTILNLDSDKEKENEKTKLENKENNDENVNNIVEEEKEEEKENENEKKEVNETEKKDEQIEKKEEIKNEEKEENDKKELKNKEIKENEEKKDEKDEKAKNEDNRNKQEENDKKDKIKTNENTNEQKVSNDKDIKENEKNEEVSNNKLEEKIETEKEKEKEDNTKTTENNIIKEDNKSNEKKEENNNIIKEENDKGKTTDNSHNELLDLLLDFVISDKVELNDILCGYFSNTLLPLIEHYPTKLLLYLYITRKDALRQIIFRSYQRSLASVAIKLLNVENFLNLILAEFKKAPNKYNKEDLIKNVEDCCLYRNKLIEELILSLTLDGYKDQKGNINKDVDLKDIFYLLNELIKEKSILTTIVNNCNIYNHLFSNLSQKVFDNNDKNKQSIYTYFTIFIANIISKINEAKEGFDFSKNLAELLNEKSIKEKVKDGNFAERFIIVIEDLLSYNYKDIISVTGAGEKKQKLGIHNIHIMELVIECFKFYKVISSIYDNILIHTEFMKKSITFYFKYQLNNIFQFKFNQLITLFLENESEHQILSDYLFNEIKIHEILIDFVKEGKNEKNKNEIIASEEVKSDNIKDTSNINEESEKDKSKDNEGEKKMYKNRFCYRSGREIKSCVYCHVIELIYKIQAKSGAKIFEKEEAIKLDINDIGYFEFVKDENSDNNYFAIQYSKKLNDVLKLSTDWNNTFENKVLPLIRKYESKLCGEAPIKSVEPPKADINMKGMLMNLLNIISNNDKRIKINEKYKNKNNNDKKEENNGYSDVNFWEVNSSISPELKAKINQNQKQKEDVGNGETPSEENEKKEENKNIEKNGNDDEELELLGIAMEAEKKEKDNSSKLTNASIDKGNIVFKFKKDEPIKDFNNKEKNDDKPVINQMNNNEEKNSKYNDTNFWQTKSESLINEQEMKKIMDDL